METEKEFSFGNIFGKQPDTPQHHNHHGPLTIVAVSADMKKDHDTFGKMDPFCVINIGGQTFTTKQAKNQGKKPVWNEKFVYNLNGSEDLLVYKVYDEDSMRGDDYIGGGVVPIKDILSGKISNDWLPLYDAKKPQEIKRDSLFRKMVNHLKHDKTGKVLISFDLGHSQQQPQQQQQQHYQQQQQQQQWGQQGHQQGYGQGGLQHPQ